MDLIGMQKSCYHCPIGHYAVFFCIEKYIKNPKFIYKYLYKSHCYQYIFYIVYND